MENTKIHFEAPIESPIDTGKFEDSDIEPQNVGNTQILPFFVLENTIYLSYYNRSARSQNI